MIIRNARVLTFDDENRVLDSADVEVRPDGTFGELRGHELWGRRFRLPTPAKPGPPLSVDSPCHTPKVIDAGGRLLMPALINCHTHLYSTLARGISIPGKPPRKFTEILRRIWWRLDRALNPDDVYYSALVGAIDSAKCGVGTLVDHHSSPNACSGSLDRIAQALVDVGLRGALCYEVSDRDDADPGIRESVRFLEAGGCGSFGLHAAFTISDRTLAKCAEANQSLGAGFHIHVAEDPCDRAAVPRLSDAGILDGKTIAAHCIHISARDRKVLAERQVNVVHNPQSNCNNAVGTADLPGLCRAGILVGLGSDGYSPRIWDEFKTAFHAQKLRAADPRVAHAEAYAALFLNNRAIVKKVYGMDVGRIQTGAAADFILVDYFPPTPLASGNLFGHLLFGIANAPVDSLMVNGKWVLREKRSVNVDEPRVAERASAQAKSLWERF